MLRVSRAMTLLSLLLSPPARANGRFPETNQLVVEPGAPEHAVVRATFGLLVTRDRGRSWELICEAAFGPQDTDPALALLPGGVMVLGLDHGVSQSDALGCNFELSPGLDGAVTDVTASRGEPGTAYALTVDSELSRVWRSSTPGAPFETVAELPELSAVTLDVAPSAPHVLYLSGVEGADGVLYRSVDRGLSFERSAIPGASASRVPYIAAIDPTDADTLYVRTYAIPGALLQTRDGGRTFARPAFEMRTPVQAFALSEDGGLLVASNPFDGTFRAERERFEFEQVRCGGATCLGFAGEDLLGCGSESLDGFMVGVSRDRGETFSRLLSQSCIAGPVGCPEASGVASECARAWPELRTRLGAERCEPVEVEPDTSCFGTGAGGESGGTVAPPETEAGADGDGGASAASRAERSDTGCSCRAAAPSRGVAFGWSLAACAFFLRGRQRSRPGRS